MLTQCYLDHALDLGGAAGPGDVAVPQEIVGHLVEDLVALLQVALLLFQGLLSFPLKASHLLSLELNLLLAPLGLLLVYRPGWQFLPLETDVVDLGALRLVFLLLLLVFASELLGDPVRPGVEGVAVVVFFGVIWGRQNMNALLAYMHVILYCKTENVSTF